MAATAQAPGDADFVATVQSYFEAFLQEYVEPSDENENAADNINDDDDAAANKQQKGEDAPRPYKEQFDSMRETERTTLFVDFQQLESYDSELATAVKEQFHQLEPHLRKSVHNVMSHLHEAYAAERDFHVSFFNLPHLCCIRELRTDKIACLTSFTATVTRTTDVRPELLSGIFQCELCQTISEPVAQQFK